MFLLSPPTVSHMCYLLVATLEKISIIYHVVQQLRLRSICDTDEKFNHSSIENKNYLIARNYKISIVNKHFAHVSTLSRQQARQKSTKRKIQVSKNVKFVMKYNLRLPDLNSLLKKHLPLLYKDPTLKLFFRKVLSIHYLKEISH